MITLTNLPQVLFAMGFSTNDNRHFVKQFPKYNNCVMMADFNKEEFTYPEQLRIESGTTSNFSDPETFVVFECVNRLLEKGYHPEHIILEKTWQLGHTGKSGRADITILDKNGDDVLLIIECKQAGKKYKEARKDLFENSEGKQLFSYFVQARSTKWLQLYASSYDDELGITFEEEIVKCHDDKNVEILAKKDASVLLFKNASEATDVFRVWDETYGKKTYHNLIFGNDTKAYNIGVAPLKKKDLKEFRKEDGIANAFKEILRHNSISDKENAFNKLLSLFICKLVDENERRDDEIVEFQYNEGTDDYYSIYERLLKLFQRGMSNYLKEDVFYLEDSYITDTLQQFTGKKRKLLEQELKESFRKTKMLSCQVFAFREVYNETLFLQNGKILVEMIELFQKYKLSYSSKKQFLGELFEELLNQGFKQDEGQYFTPIPITRYIWNSLPYDKFINRERLINPKVVDFACGSGHFLIEGISAVRDIYKQYDIKINDEYISESFYGVDKDNRLARVSKVALLLNGANHANIRALDGLEHDENFYGVKNSFDILVANPPYAVRGFKGHLTKSIIDEYTILKKISFTSDNIEFVFVERMLQLLRPGGVAGIVLPSSILSESTESAIMAREIILQNFLVRAISIFGGKTFGETPTNTAVFFLERYQEPPKRSSIVCDSVDAIFNAENLQDWEDNEILERYLSTIGVEKSIYQNLVMQQQTFDYFDGIPYFANYTDAFRNSTKAMKLQNEREFQKLSDQQKQAELLRLFYEYVLPIEREKIYYFALTYTQTTLIVNAPSETEQQKDFLGYTFSKSKGKEGLKETEGLLTNPTNRSDENKLAWFVRQSFNNLQFKNEQLNQYITYLPTSNLMDFSLAHFTKKLNPSATRKTEIISQYPLVRLGTLASISSGNSAPQEKDFFTNGTYPFFRVSDVAKYHLTKNLTETASLLNDSGIKGLRLFPKGTILFPKSGASTYLDHRAIMGVDGYVVSHLATINVLDESVLLTEFLYEVLTLIKAKEIKEDSGYPSLNAGDLEALKIPCPPLSIQQQIMVECEKVDKEYNTSRMAIDEYKQKIAEVFENLDVITRSQGGVKLHKIVHYITDRVAINKLNLEDYISTDNMLPEYEGITQYKGVPNIKSAIQYKVGDILISNIRPYLHKIWLADKDGGCSPDVLVLRINHTEQFSPQYIYNTLKRKKFFDYMMENVSGVKMPRADKAHTLQYEVASISIDEQKHIAAIVNDYGQQILNAQAVMNECATRKKAILNNFLK